MIKVEYVNPFYQATVEVFKLMLDIDATRILPGQPTAIPSKQVIIEIGIIGDLTGAIRYRFPESMILQMVTIMSGMDFDQVDDFVASAMGEIANIISGNAATKLSANRYMCDILPPRMYIDGDDAQQDAHFKPDLTIPMKTYVGDLFIDIALKQAEPA